MPTYTVVEPRSTTGSAFNGQIIVKTIDRAKLNQARNPLPEPVSIVRRRDTASPTALRQEGPRQRLKARSTALRPPMTTDTRRRRSEKGRPPLKMNRFRHMLHFLTLMKPK